MNLKILTDKELLKRTQHSVQKERKSTTEVLHHLLEVERRRAFAELGFGSLFEYCVKELKYSESSAQRRIEAMRLLKALPELEEKIENGSLSLSVVAQAQRFFRQEEIKASEVKKELLLILEGKSSRVAERELLGRSTEPLQSRERTRALTPSHTEYKFVGDEQFAGMLEELRGLLAHKLPRASLSELLAEAVKIAKQQLDPSLPASKKPRSKTERTIWQRDGAQCSYVDSTTNRRCQSRHGLQIDHITPRALGGTGDPENLRILCFQHNQWEARQVFGQVKMESHWREEPFITDRA